MGCCPEGSATAKMALVKTGQQRWCLWGEEEGRFGDLLGLVHPFSGGLVCPQVVTEQRRGLKLPGIQSDSSLSEGSSRALMEATFPNRAKHPACEEGSACSQKTQEQKQNK